jgi:hypothetical protein
MTYGEKKEEKKKFLSTGCIIAIGVGVLGLIILFAIGGYFVSAMNNEVRLRNTIKAKMQDNESEFDNMWKKIAQTAQVPEQKKNALMDIFNSHAKARSGGQKGGSLALWIKESVPQADMKVYDNLMNIITASRDRWTMRQKELVDFKREHDNLLDVFPSSLVCSTILGREKMEITIVSSSRSKRAMTTGVDDDIDLFPQKKSPAEKE